MYDIIIRYENESKLNIKKIDFIQGTYSVYQPNKKKDLVNPSKTENRP